MKLSERLLKMKNQISEEESRYTKLQGQMELLQKEMNEKFNCENLKILRNEIKRKEQENEDRRRIILKETKRMEKLLSKYTV